MLRQRSRPYLFSNSLAPSLVGAAIKVIDLLSASTELRDKLERNTDYFRAKMTEVGFDIKPGIHAIVPVMLYDAKLSQVMADKLLEEGIYVIGFFYPVVPKEQARIRVQISAAHEPKTLGQSHCRIYKGWQSLKRYQLNELNNFFVKLKIISTFCQPFRTGGSCGHKTKRLQSGHIELQNNFGKQRNCKQAVGCD